MAVASSQRLLCTYDQLASCKKPGFLCGAQHAHPGDDHSSSMLLTWRVFVLEGCSSGYAIQLGSGVCHTLLRR